MTRSVLICAVLVAGCASGQGAPISYGNGPGSAIAAPAPAARATPAPEPRWTSDDRATLSAFALRREDAQPYDPAHLPRTHRLAGNETLHDVAARYQIPFAALVEQNRLSPPFTLAPGSEVELPPPRFHVAARGETLADIADAFAIDTRSLALLNRMQPPYEVRENDRIVLPATARPWLAPARPGSAQTQPSPPSSRRFRRPLPGAIVATFGAQSDGARLDGIEVAGREGELIRAAADGEVVYAGADLPAYGVLVLVRHRDDYVSAYAYGRRELVRAGQVVRAGDPLAELGPRSDGRARVLFQIRRGREVLDPVPLLGD